MADEGHVAEVVRAELKLETVLGDLSCGRVHDAGVSDEHVDRVALVPEGFAERCRGIQRRQVQVSQRHFGRRGPFTDRRERGLTLAGIAHRENEVCSGCGEPSCNDQAHAVAAAGEDDPFAGEIGDGEIDGCTGHEGHLLLRKGRVCLRAEVPQVCAGSAARSRTS